MRARSPGRLRLVIATALPAVCFGLLGAGISVGSASAPGGGSQPTTVAFLPLSGSPIDPENTPTPTAKPTPTATPKATPTATPRATETPPPTARPTPVPTQAPTPASTPSAAPPAGSPPPVGAAPAQAPSGGGGGGTRSGGGAPIAQASVAPAAAASATAAPAPPSVSVQPNGPASPFGGLAVLPGALAALGKDPRTNQLNLDVIAAEALVAVSIGLCILLTELRRRRLV